MRSVVSPLAIVLGGVALGLGCGTNGSAPLGSPDAGVDGSTAREGHDANTLPHVDSGVHHPGDSGTPPTTDSGDTQRVDTGVSPPADSGASDATDATSAIIDAAPSACSGAVASTSTSVPGLPALPAFTTPAGFTLELVAQVPSARQLAALPNGDLLVATSSASLYLIPNAEAAGLPGAPVVFATPSETPAQGLVFDPASCTVYLSSQHNVYAIPYVDGQASGAAASPIASVRTGSISPNRPAGDTDNHTTTSLGFADGTLYAGIGSSCNACVETDPTRASIQAIDGTGATITRATRIRNPIALTANPVTGTLWAGGAGQDDLAEGHPFEFFDAVTLHSGVADYGWPACEENHVAYVAGSSCGGTVAPLIELPAYSTIIGATFYPPNPSGAHAFPAMYRGGLFLTAHGSWHQVAGGKYAAAPQVVFVSMQGDAPVTAVNWTDPTKQWSTFIGGFQETNGTTRVGRPTGITVGSQGSLFVADDQNGYVYRVRPM